MSNGPVEDQAKPTTPIELCGAERQAPNDPFPNLEKYVII